MKPKARNGSIEAEGGTPGVCAAFKGRCDAGEADYAALAQFRYQLRTFLAFSEAAAQRAGLTPQQHQALLAIKGFSGREAASVGDIARFLLVRHHTAVELGGSEWRN